MSEEPRRRGPARWLLDGRGRRYRQPSSRHVKATHFHVTYQPSEGALWRTLVQPNGTAIALPLDVTHAEFRAVASRAGGYMLVPVDAAGVQRGEPPQRLDVRVIAENDPPSEAPHGAADGSGAVLQSSRRGRAPGSA